MDFYELKLPRFWIAVYTEFQATMLFVLIATGSAMSLNSSSFLHIALTFALCIATFVQATAHVSGGHLNPAVTCAMVAARKITLVRGVLYIIAQMVGAICGSAILKGLTPDGSEGTLAANMLMNGVDAGQGFGVEFLITFQFVWLIFATVDMSRTDLKGSAGLAIGFSIAIGHLFAIGYTNCGMNPARSFGPAVVSGYWNDHWVFWVGPILGGVLAGLQYEFLLAPTATPEKFKKFATCQDSVPSMEIENPVHMEMVKGNSSLDNA